MPALATPAATVAASWFELPAADLGRATQFYQSVLGLSLMPEDFGPLKSMIFPHVDTETGGAVTQGDGYVAGHGAIVYLATAEPLEAVAARVTAAGGKVLTPVIVLPGDLGTYLHFADSEGNRVGLHRKP